VYNVGDWYTSADWHFRYQIQSVDYTNCQMTLYALDMRTACSYSVIFTFDYFNYMFGVKQSIVIKRKLHLHGEKYAKIS